MTANPTDRYGSLGYLILLTAGIAAILLSILSYSSHQQLRNAEEERYQAYLLAEQLRQSSDQLTSMARAYVATGKLQYRDYFDAILKIRDGQHPRPQHYNRAYWDFLVIPNGIAPYPNGRTAPLQQLLIEAGFSSKEMALLLNAQASSDNLARIESEAFMLLEGENQEQTSLGQDRLRPTPGQIRATQLLYDHKYLQAKAEIMGFLNLFDEQQSERTRQQVASLAANHYLYGTSTLICYGILIGTLILMMTRRRAEQLQAKRYLEEQIKAHTETLERQNKELNELVEHLDSAREQLVESEKMSALGRMVAGFSHEINTPIGIGVTAASSIAEQTKKLQQQHREGALTQAQFLTAMEHITLSSDLIEKNMQRAAELVSRFKQVSVDQSIDHRRTINLRDYISEVVATLAPRFKHQNITIYNQVAPPIELHVNPGLIAQVITNLIVNASVHAFDDNGGTIDINTQETSDHVTLIFSDNGRGMSADVLKHLYDPFFTTKRDRGGTGLGMHIVHNLVTQQLRGTLRCESRLGAGAQFYITLPLIPLAADAKGPISG